MLSYLFPKPACHFYVHHDVCMKSPSGADKKQNLQEVQEGEPSRQVPSPGIHAHAHKTAKHNKPTKNHQVSRSTLPVGAGSRNERAGRLAGNENRCTQWESNLHDWERWRNESKVIATTSLPSNRNATLNRAWLAPPGYPSPSEGWEWVSWRAASVTGVRSNLLALFFDGVLARSDGALEKRGVGLVRNFFVGNFFGLSVRSSGLFGFGGGAGSLHGLGDLLLEIDVEFVVALLDEDDDNEEDDDDDQADDRADPGVRTGIATANERSGLASVDEVEDGGQDERHDRHELDEDVQRWAGGILEGVANSVARDDGIVVHGLLALALAKEALLDVLLGVVPGTASVGHHDGKHEAGGQSADQEATEGSRAEHEANDKREEDGDGAGEDHLAEGRRGGDGDAVAVPVEGFLAGVVGGPVHRVELLPPVGVGAVVVLHLGLVELQAHLEDDGHGALSNGEHGEGTEQVRKHGAEEQATDDGRALEVDDATVAGEAGLLHVGGDEADGRQHSGADGETLTGGGGGVSESVEGVGAVAHVFLHSRGHLGDAAGVVGDGAVGVSGEGHTKRGEHAHGSDGDSVHVGAGLGTEDGHNEDEGGHSARDHADTDTLDDDRGRSSLRGLGD